jgi:hypothetical protein
VGLQKARCSMVADLKHRVGLAGRTEGEVINLLGQPDMEVDSSTSVYLLCRSSGDIHTLELSWRDGRAASVRVREL